MAPILVATVPAQQQQQQVEGGPRRFERTWDPKCPIDDIMNTDMSPVLPKREFNPVIVPVMSPAPVGGSLLQAPPSPQLSAPGPSRIPGLSTMPEPSVTHPPPAMPRLNARGRKLLPDGPIKRRTQDLSTSQSSTQSSISAPKQRAALVLAPAAAAAPALASAAAPAPASTQITAQPAVVAVVNQKSKPKKENEKVRCTCSYCVEKHGPNGNMIAEKTWKEHKRADMTAKEGTVQDPKCRKCQKQTYPHHPGTESLVLVQTFGQTSTGHREKTIKDALRGYPDLKQHCHRGQSDYQIKAKTEIVPQLLIESRTLSASYPMSALRSPRWAEAGLPTQFPRLSTGARSGVSQARSR
ncbi:hypothetical protein CPAR01_00103 [Colletotrichum paranaense]|uniref:Uncharacterized protein n=1 Tax=Colletotrichum paranaense TaxID=1914294 RepID=A0ABQ9T2W4_9PEZI|nr:uncharacterized protein CPAR01_00103 [Colletotrichum paranaense]KAK1546136.1 hypothetical protein CPAR01_00103 [Colletotrichum paranaense]